MDAAATGPEKPPYDFVTVLVQIGVAAWAGPVLMARSPDVRSAEPTPAAAKRRIPTAMDMCAPVGASRGRPAPDLGRAVRFAVDSSRAGVVLQPDSVRETKRGARRVSSALPVR
ncbi:hypothetical protein GCM10010349_68650 [Streptomyces flavofungini]|nr:hypothetical protein GCM10010349_68650 [Streptomyces flavofungini]